MHTDQELIGGLRAGLAELGAGMPAEVSLPAVRALGRQRRRRLRGVLGSAAVAGVAAVAGLFIIITHHGPDTLGVAHVVSSHVVVEQNATALVGSWKVAGAAGEQPDAVLDLGQQVVLYRRCGEIYGSWTATPAGLLLISDSSESTGCYQQDHLETVGWLAAAAGYRVNRDGSRTLLSVTGAPLATLLPGGDPGVRKDFLRTPPVLTPALRALLVSGPSLPAGVTPATSADVVGRWGPFGGDPAAGSNQPYVTFLADGTIRGSDGCNDIGGNWRLGAAGSWLSEGGFMTEVGCSGMRELGPSHFVRRVSYDGSTLTFYDTTGRVVERLQRTSVAAGLQADPPAALLRIASAAASADGSGGFSATAVKTRLGAAIGAVSANLAPAATRADPVWVIEATGSFSCRTCSQTLDGGPPTGKVLTLVVNARNYANDFSGIGNRAIELAKLGQVVDLTSGH